MLAEYKIKSNKEKIVSLLRRTDRNGIENVIQYALDAVGRAVNVGDGGIVQSGADHAVRTGIDDSSGAAGLCDQACAD